MRVYKLSTTIYKYTQRKKYITSGNLQYKQEIRFLKEQKIFGWEARSYCSLSMHYQTQYGGAIVLSGLIRPYKTLLSARIKNINNHLQVYTEKKNTYQVEITLEPSNIIFQN